MKSIIILTFLILLPVTNYGQDIFEKYADNNDVVYVSIKPNMFKMLAKSSVGSDDPEAKEFLNMVDKITSLKTVSTKNPEISKRQFKQLQKSFPHIVFYPLENGKIKVPAGWLIEQCGWKGKRVGNTGSHA